MVDRENERNLLAREAQANPRNVRNIQSAVAPDGGDAYQGNAGFGSIGLETNSDSVNGLFNQYVSTKIESNYIFPSDLFNDSGTPNGSNGSRVEFYIIGAANNAETRGAIALYMPPNVVARYTGQWQDESLADATKAVNEVLTGVGQVTSGAATGSGLFQSTQNVANQLVGGESARNAQTRTLVNPHKALLYQGHNFRGLDLSFDMFARNAEESNTIKLILDKFKLSSHPGDENGGSTWIYPDEFLIRFVGPGANSSQYMFRFGPCILEDVSITYGPDQSSFFAGTGAPVHVGLQLTFKEVFQLTKNFIAKGW